MKLYLSGGGGGGEGRGGGGGDWKIGGAPHNSSR